MENLKQELSSTKVTLHLDYKQSFFFLGPSSKTRETRKWPRAWLMARDAFYFLVRLLLSSTLSRAFTPLTKPVEKRETARRLHHLFWCFVEMLFIQLQNQKSCFFVSKQCLYKQVFVTKYSDLICLHYLSLTGPLPVRGRCSQTKVKLSISLWGIHHSLFLSALAARFVLQDK